MKERCDCKKWDAGLAEGGSLFGWNGYNSSLRPLCRFLATTFRQLWIFFGGHMMSIWWLFGYLCESIENEQPNINQQGQGNTHIHFNFWPAFPSTTSVFDWTSRLQIDSCFCKIQIVFENLRIVGQWRTLSEGHLLKLYCSGIKITMAMN